jgi:hypothetical protein
MSNFTVILQSSSNEVIKSAALKLEKDGCIKVIAVLGWENQKNNTFANAEVINQWDLISRGLAGKFEGASIRFFTSDLVKKTHWAENIALSMMDRIDPLKKQTYFQRKNLYIYLICYWASYIEEANLHTYICAVVPHEVSDFILFAVCKAMNVNTVIFNYTRLPGIYYVSDSYTEFPSYLPSKSKGGLIDQGLPDNIMQHLANIRSTYDKAMPVDSTEILSISLKLSNSSVVQTSVKVLERLYRLSIKLIKLIRNSNQKWEVIRDIAQSRINSMAWARTKYEYVKRTVTFERPDKFVYFLLNFQPECTTSPMGGEFVDQFLAIAMMARNVPKDTYVLVKEHPGQLIEFEHYNSLGRDENFYHRIESLTNVRFVPDRADHFELLDASMCVACVNGTVGWEAVVRGKAAVVFGDAWYQGAPGVYKVIDDKSCKAALNFINIGVDISDNAVKTYLKIFLDSCEEICLTEEYARCSNMAFDFEKNSERVYLALKRKLITV